MVKLRLESRIYNYITEIQCAVLDKITCQLPHALVDTSKISFPQHVKLADPDYHRPLEIDMLISAELYFQIIFPEVIKLGPGLPVIQNTQLGWLVCGTAPIAPSSRANYNSTSAVCSSSVSLFCSSEVSDVNDIIPKFWQLEEITNQKHLSADDKLCEQRFLESYKRLEDGRFEVDLPMRNKDDYLKLGNSYDSAYRRFKSLENRFGKNPDLYSQYKEFIDEYVNLGHGKYVESGVDEIENRVFLAHHCVIRDEALSTKLRVVFDASSKTSSGLSLNDVTLKGFPVQPELFEILCRFRTFEFVLVTDIKKMYRMVQINPNQRFLQNILWREHPDEEIKIIELQTVTYGTNSAPFLATRCLNQLASDEELNFPLAAKVILKQCYVDDILSGANSKEEALELRNQLISLLKSGGFRLHKWCSNNMSLLESADIELDNREIDIYDDSFSNKVLGIVWQPHQDIFKISIPSLDYSNEIKVTKRQVLSKIAQMFDPMGLVGPVVVVAKILMQEIWASKIEWDDEIPPHILQKWKNFSSTLHHLKNLKIPRWLFNSTEIVEIQIHGFSDASMAAYGACIYIRAVYSDHSVTCNLLCSKSRIAPLKTVTLPRLELCGAVLLTRLAHKIQSIIDIKIKKVYLWTDSSVVLSWLHSPPNRWTTFVGNRVSEVQELTIDSEWKHVRSQENPADCISRGMSSLDILSNELWFHGPKFLSEFNIRFSNEEYPKVDSVPEERKVALTQTKIQTVIDWSRFSNFTRLQRTVAYCLRFINRHRVTGPLTVDELKRALQQIIHLIQRESFPKEIEYLESCKELDSSQNVFKESSLKCLHPFLDSEGILRVSGRLAKADIDYNQRFPILLPAKNHVVRLLIWLEHVKLFHAGPQAVLANLRLRYWPVHGMVEVKSAIKGCTTCYKFRAQTSTQLMGSLPMDRVTIARPFLKVGIDFGGPFTIKQSRLRGSTTTKAYLALFICMVTKAVHLELVSSLSTDAFIHTLKRFIARRGCPITIYSDNATNFQGANNVLREVHLFFKSQKNRDEIHTFLSNKEIEWRFIPPVSPHWGGLWEAGIKSTKFHLRRIVGNLTLTFEELTTVLAQIEAILNSRPLCPISSDPSDLSCLTPSHFLIGEPLTSFPEKDVSNVPDNKLNFWQLCSKIKQNFWKRWSVEYLSRLQNRPKWVNVTKNLEKDMIVLIKEDNVPPLKWPLARIIEINPGSDGKVRLAQIRTKEGTFKRPITKLCPLPFEGNC